MDVNNKKRLDGTLQGPHPGPVSQMQLWKCDLMFSRFMPRLKYINLWLYCSLKATNAKTICKLFCYSFFLIVVLIHSFPSTILKYWRMDKAEAIFIWFIGSPICCERLEFLVFHIISNRLAVMKKTGFTYIVELGWWKNAYYHLCRPALCTISQRLFSSFCHL